MGRTSRSKASASTDGEGPEDPKSAHPARTAAPHSAPMTEVFLERLFIV
jgi:hypothetical protein